MKSARKESLLADGFRAEVYSLRCVLREEPSDAQWREAEAEFCGRLLRGEERHLTLAEVLGTAERLARLKLCHEVLEAASVPESLGEHGLAPPILGRSAGGAVTRCKPCPALVAKLREAATAQFISDAVRQELSRQLTPWDEQTARTLAATACRGASAAQGTPGGALPSAVPQGAPVEAQHGMPAPQAACHGVGSEPKTQPEAGAMAQAAAVRSGTGTEDAKVVLPYTIASPSPPPPCSPALPLPLPQRMSEPGAGRPPSAHRATSQTHDGNSAASRGGSHGCSPSPERGPIQRHAGDSDMELPADSDMELDESVSEAVDGYQAGLPTRLPPRPRSRSRSRERGCVEDTALPPGPPVGWTVGPHYHLSPDEEAWAVDLYMWLRSRPGCRATTGEMIRANQSVPKAFLARSGRGPLAYMELFAGESGLWTKEHIGVCFRFTAVVAAAVGGRPGGGGAPALPHQQSVAAAEGPTSEGPAAAGPAAEGSAGGGGATALQLAGTSECLGQNDGGGVPGARPSSHRPAAETPGKEESTDAFAVRLYGYLRAQLPHGVRLCHLKG
ncbi:hypothetical protein HYH03_004801 [Edaphochlamys debaryana]|uniref:Uncharacterized protein n=1 Tax=Edaphochlamys debaryana TaxID=47281 RepID=A0A835Y8Z9_9CHLO|nr:hypothetical protein HYH03_004801 [Edaphochlamys debaryana]|eukprot:KAG2497212.1 hypothetical protein HYH03_004801 [Edaphochlamys debaryana]